MQGDNLHRRRPLRSEHLLGHARRHESMVDEGLIELTSPALSCPFVQIDEPPQKRQRSGSCDSPMTLTLTPSVLSSPAIDEPPTLSLDSSASSVPSPLTLPAPSERLNADDEQDDGAELHAFQCVPSADPPLPRAVMRAHLQWQVQLVAALVDADAWSQAVLSTAITCGPCGTLEMLMQLTPQQLGALHPRAGALVRGLLERFRRQMMRQQASTNENDAPQDTADAAVRPTATSAAPSVAVA